MKADPEIIFSKLERIGKGSFGEVYKGYVSKWIESRRSKAKLKFLLTSTIAFLVVINLCHLIYSKTLPYLQAKSELFVFVKSSRFHVLLLQYIIVKKIVNKIIGRSSITFFITLCHEVSISYKKE